MTQAEQMISAARACLGVPFHHQGRDAKFGLDCIGLIVVALRRVGMEVQDSTDYARRPDGRSLIAGLEAHGAVRVSMMQGGDVLVFRYDNQPQHVGLATSGTAMIHSFAPVGRVVETGLGAYWQRRLVGIYRFPLKED